MSTLSPEQVDITNDSEHQPLSPPPSSDSSSSVSSGESSNDDIPEVADSANNVQLEEENNSVSEAGVKEKTAKTVKAKKIRVLPDWKFEESVDEASIINGICAGEHRHPDAMEYVQNITYEVYSNLFQRLNEYPSLVILVGSTGLKHGIAMHGAILRCYSPLMTKYLDASPESLTVIVPHYSHIVLRHVVQLLYTGLATCIAEEDVPQVWECMKDLGIEYEEEHFSKLPPIPTYHYVWSGSTPEGEWPPLTNENDIAHISIESEAHSNMDEISESVTNSNENLREIPVPESEIPSVNKAPVENHILDSQMPEYSGNDTSQEVSVRESEIPSEKENEEDIPGLETASIPDTATRPNETEDDIIEQKPVISTDEPEVTFLYAKILRRPTPLRISTTAFNPNNNGAYMPNHSRARAALLKRFSHKRKLEKMQDSSNMNGGEKKKCENNDDIVLDSNPIIIDNDAFKKMFSSGKLSLPKLLMNTRKPGNPVESQTDENLQTKEKESSRLELKREKLHKASTIAGANNSPEQMPRLSRELSPISDISEAEEIPRLNSAYDEEDQTYCPVPRKAPVSPDITAPPFSFPCTQLPEATKVSDHHDSGNLLSIADQRLNDHDKDAEPEPRPSTSAAFRAKLATRHRCESSPATDQPPSETDGQNNLQDKEVQLVIGSRKMGIPNDATVHSYIEDYPNDKVKTKEAFSKIVSKFFSSRGTESTLLETGQPLAQDNNETNGSLADHTAAPESSPASRVRTYRPARRRGRGRSVNAPHPGSRVLRSRPVTEHDINNIREQEQSMQETPDGFQRDE